jgi:hypothetical protein
MSVLKATLADGRTVEYLPELKGEGGMKRVYFTADGKSVVCFFKDQSLKGDPSRRKRLDAILGKYNPTTHPETGKYFMDLFCWPTGIVTAPQFGVMTPKYSKNYFFATGPWTGKEKVGKWFSSPKLRRMLPAGERGNWLNYLQLCFQMSRAVRKLHLTGLAHSDLSSNNVLIDPSHGRCAVIDIDSLVVPGTYPPDVLGTPGYIAPEVLATQHLAVDDKKRFLPCNFTDLHALAVLIYEYLLRRHPLRGPKVHSQNPDEDELLSMGPKALFIENPTDASNNIEGLSVLVEQLGPYLHGLMLKAFVDGLHHPNSRPGAYEWEKALYQTQDLLMPCTNSSCDEKWFVYLDGQPIRCPWCKTEQREPVPLLEFFYSPQGRRGQYRDEKYKLTAHDQRRLHRWHVFSNVKPSEGVDEEVLAYITKQQGHWLLVNRALNTLVSPAGNPVPVGQACALADGDEVVLSKEDNGRLATVRMIS